MNTPLLLEDLLAGYYYRFVQIHVTVVHKCKVGSSGIAGLAENNTHPKWLAKTYFQACNDPDPTHNGGRTPNK